MMAKLLIKLQQQNKFLTFRLQFASAKLNAKLCLEIPSRICVAVCVCGVYLMIIWDGKIVFALHARISCVLFFICRLIICVFHSWLGTNLSHIPHENVYLDCM